MKIFTLVQRFALSVLSLVLFLGASQAHARQYIQCAADGTFDRMVVNLNGSRSTLFLTDGVHNPDEMRILKRIQEVEGTATHAVFESLPMNEQDDVLDRVMIPREWIGKASNSFDIEFQMIERSTGRMGTYSFSCFSSLYQD